MDQQIWQHQTCRSTVSWNSGPGSPLWWAVDSLLSKGTIRPALLIYVTCWAPVGLWVWGLWLSVSPNSTFHHRDDQLEHSFPASYLANSPRRRLMLWRKKRQGKGSGSKKQEISWQNGLWHLTEFFKPQKNKFDSLCFKQRCIYGTCKVNHCQPLCEVGVGREGDFFSLSPSSFHPEPWSTLFRWLCEIAKPIFSCSH